MSQDVTESRFRTLLSELRCLVCENQSLTDSNAPLAKDLRDPIYHQIQAGESDAQIRDYLTQRYGRFILYRPPFQISPLILWVTPFLCLMAGLFFGIYVVKNQKEG